MQEALTTFEEGDMMSRKYVYPWRQVGLAVSIGALAAVASVVALTEWLQV